MANKRSSNTFFIDTQHSSSSDDLVIANIKVWYIVLTATSANARLVLQDTSGDVKGDYRVAASGTSQEFYFKDNPMVFPNGISASTLTNAVASLVIDESRG